MAAKRSPADNLTNMGKGRPPGVKNKFGQEAKEVFAMAFQGLGGVPALTTWAKANKETFYKFYSKLIPVELHGTGNGMVNITISEKESKL